MSCWRCSSYVKTNAYELSCTEENVYLRMRIGWGKAYSDGRAATFAFVYLLNSSPRDFKLGQFNLVGVYQSIR
jgi:hypothetical protein